MTFAPSLRGVGLGWRQALAADLLRAPGAVDFVEIVADTCFAQPLARREAQAIRETWPVALHGVKLSLGAADGVDPARAKRLGDLARELRVEAVTEHVAIVRGRALEIGHLTPLPRTREAVGVVANNAAVLRTFLPDRPLYLENIAWSFEWPDDELDEGAFHEAIARATGCPLLLDLGNLVANAKNAGREPRELLASYPLDRVGMIHLAGGVLEDGFYYDTHAHAVPDEELELLEETVAVTGAVPIVLERDADFPPWPELAREVDAARAIAGAARAPTVCRTDAPEPGALSPRLADAQERLAALLTSFDAPVDASPFDRRAIARSREILERKRVDDALPLVPRVAGLPQAFDLALACVRAAPRAPRHAALADALRIAERATREPDMVEHASVDHLLLRATFRLGSGGVPEARSGPFVGRVRLGARTIWALKGIGAHAGVRLIERRST